MIPSEIRRALLAAERPVKYTLALPSFHASPDGAARAPAPVGPGFARVPRCGGYGFGGGIMRRQSAGATWQEEAIALECPHCGGGGSPGGFPSQSVGRHPPVPPPP